jgi:hypothetical protein
VGPNLEAWLRDKLPSHLECPVTLGFLTDPVLAADGITYQREALLGFINHAKSRECLLCGVVW